MIAIPGNVRVWLATGHTDMRRGFPSLARLIMIGACLVALDPLVQAIRAHVLSAERIHTDDRACVGETENCHRPDLDLCSR